MQSTLQGGAKASEAAVIYQELGERHNWTVPLYNGAAACAMQLGNWEEAEQYLQANCLPTVLSAKKLTASFPTDIWVIRQTYACFRAFGMCCRHVQAVMRCCCAGCI